MPHHGLPWLLSGYRICLPMQETQETRVRSLSWEDPQRGKWQPIPVLLRGKSHGQRSLEDYSPWGRRELDMNEQLSTFTRIVSVNLLCKILFNLIFTNWPFLLISNSLSFNEIILLSVHCKGFQFASVTYFKYCSGTFSPICFLKLYIKFCNPRISGIFIYFCLGAKPFISWV